jgi:hypothetical protein
VLPPRSTSQILSAEDEVAGCHIAVPRYYRVHQITKEVRCHRQKWMRWSVLTIFLSERGEADFASDCRVCGRQLSEQDGVDV